MLADKIRSRMRKGPPPKIDFGINENVQLIDRDLDSRIFMILEIIPKNKYSSKGLSESEGSVWSQFNSEFVYKLRDRDNNEVYKYQADIERVPNSLSYILKE